MKNFLKSAVILMTGIVAFSACNKQKEELKPGEQKGPEVTITAPQDVVMGASLDYSIATESGVTLKVTLKNGSTTIDTGTAASGSFKIPFQKDVENYTATLSVSARSKTGITEKSADISITRPVFASLSLKGEDGSEFTMEKKSDYEYVAKVSSQTFKAKISGTTPIAINFGWDGSAVVVDGADFIPFSNATEGEYEITFNTKTFAAGPFDEPEIPSTGTGVFINGVETIFSEEEFTITPRIVKDYWMDLDLTKGGEVKIEGIADIDSYWVDPDFIKKTGNGTYEFLAADGKYRVSVVTVDPKWIRFERMHVEDGQATKYADFEDGDHALWIVGAGCYGKPVINPDNGWNPFANRRIALCGAEVEDNVYQWTFEAGKQIQCDGNSFKFYGTGQDFWGRFELKFNNYESFENDYIYPHEPGSDGNGGDDGNIFNKAPFEEGVLYRITVDMSGGKNAAVLNCVALGAAEPTLNGQELGSYGYQYYFADKNAWDRSSKSWIMLNVKQGDVMNFEHMGRFGEYELDEDFMVKDGSTVKFAAIDGNYLVTPVVESGITLMRVDPILDYTGGDDGHGGTFYGPLVEWRTDIDPAGFQLHDVLSYPYDGKCLYLQGGEDFGKPAIFTYGGWNPNDGYRHTALPGAQQKPGVFQWTFIAGKSIKVDALGCKVLGQRHYLDNSSADSRAIPFASYEYFDTDNFAINPESSDMYIETPLEEGAKYRLILDMTGCGNEDTNGFIKQDGYSFWAPAPGTVKASFLKVK